MPPATTVVSVAPCPLAAVVGAAAFTVTSTVFAVMLFSLSVVGSNTPGANTLVARNVAV